MVESNTAIVVKTNMKMSEVFFVRLTENESITISLTLESKESVDKYALQASDAYINYRKHFEQLLSCHSI